MEEIIDNDPNIPTSQHPVLHALNEKTARLEVDNINLRNRISELQTTSYSIADQVKEIILEAVPDEEMSEDVAKKLAKLFSLELTKTITVSGTISFSGRAEVSIFEDISAGRELVYNTDASDLSISVYGYELDRFDYDVDDVDFEEV